MTKTWSIQEAKANFAEVVRQAEEEPQVITRHGKEVVQVLPLGEKAVKRKRTALEALRGNYDFSKMPDDNDWLPLDRSGSLRLNPFEEDE